MRLCLTTPGGYYGRPYERSSGAADPFGAKGDFTTSPEISQIFGELVGIWILSEWMAQGKPKTGVQLIEVGPGRGTLMHDVLRTLSSFKQIMNAVEGLYLVETSEHLRAKQCDLLCGTANQRPDGGENSETRSAKYQGGSLDISWVQDISELPTENGKTPFIVAHEFFDALPIHAFQSVPPDPDVGEKGELGHPQLRDAAGGYIVRPTKASKGPQWRELLVADAWKSGSMSTTTGLRTERIGEHDQNDDVEPEFQLTLAKASTPSSLVLPQSSDRYRRLEARPGSSIEISPDSQRYVQEFAKRIGDTASATDPPTESTSPDHPGAQPISSGAALIIDYGPATTIPANSLRGVKAHEHVSPFLTPGLTDISADVDFGALVDACLAASENVEVHGPVEQGVWVMQMGGPERLKVLLSMFESRKGRGAVEDQRVRHKQQELESGWKRLTGGEGQGMGKVYKFMAIVPECGGRRRPVGFGGGVSG